MVNVARNKSLTAAPMVSPMRVFGIIVLIGSALVAALAVFALLRTGELADLMSRLALHHGRRLDGDDWQRHWVVSFLLMGLIATIGLAAGVGLVRNRLWGLLLWCSLATFVPAIAFLQETLYAKYEFETTDAPEYAAAVAMAAVLWVFFARTRRSSDHQSTSAIAL